METTRQQKEHLYNLGWRTGYKFALEKLIKMKRPTKEDMKKMLSDLKEGN